jgi:hypothetical protein
MRFAHCKIDSFQCFAREPTFKFGVDIHGRAMKLQIIALAGPTRLFAVPF